ncbi:MAG: DUF1365 domain-containing protein [Porticoccaceae bacterium]
MNSRLYSGILGHCRHMPVVNQFTYKVFMLCLDLDELDRVFNQFWLWSARAANFAWFRREDHLGDKSQPLAQSVRDLVYKRTGKRPQGPIRLLTNLRYFFYKSNPVSFYYCYKPDGKSIEAIVAEVTNTPWGEMYCYVLSENEKTTPQADKHNHLYFQTSKAFTVSPYMPLDMEYRFEFSQLDDGCIVKMQNHRQGKKIFDVELNLTAQPINSKTLAAQLIKIPLMSVKVTAGIYWQALKIWIKGVPFLGHANENNKNLEGKGE